MLTSLSIKNFTIVSDLNLDFEAGMTAFTGETGAGKSIMIDALSLLLGARAEVSMIRDGCELCELSAAFEVANNPEVLAWLALHELDTENEIIIRRCLYSSGRSKSFINGSLYPLQKVRELGDLLLHIHGQNQQYHLLKHEVHRSQLDAFAMNDKRLAKVRTSYLAVKELEKQIAVLEADIGNEDQKALLDYQLQELNELALFDGEIEQLNQEHKLLSNATGLLASSQQILLKLHSDEGRDVLSLLQQTLQQLDEMLTEDDGLEEIRELLNGAYIQAEEATSSMASYQEQIELNPERLHLVEQRIATIFDLARKHKVKAEMLYEHYCLLQKQRQNYDEHETQLAKLKQALLQQNQLYLAEATKLSQSRAKESKALAQQITALIHSLGMPNGEVFIELSALDKPTITGLDKVEYQVCLNPGSTAKPLAKIASGGELSRISLAIQVLTAAKKAYPTLMFDEVDTGIGGATAAKVGQLLRKLGDHTQVFCVTHQAQVASNANWHMKVIKKAQKNATHSEVCLLTEQEKVAELARMISGMEMTEQTMAHARALLEQVS